MTTKIINGYYHASGSRKEASARVFMKEGTGKTTVNGRPIELYFGKDTTWLARAVAPIKLIRQEGLFDMMITVKGGGINGQSGAVAHGIARALDLYAMKNSPVVEFVEGDEEQVAGQEGESSETESETTVSESTGPLGVERWHAAIRKAGHLTRDSRRVLRKKVGLVKARKAKQFSKR